MTSPIRTCVACRQRQATPALLRVVLDPAGALILDPGSATGGRGAWVCARSGCLARLQSKPAMAGRSLRGRPRGAGDLVEAARADALARCARALVATWRAGLARAGKVQGRAAVQGGAEAVLLARDAGAHVGPDSGLPPAAWVPVPWSTRDLGALLGRGPRASVTLLPGRPSQRLLRELQRHHALG